MKTTILFSFIFLFSLSLVSAIPNDLNNKIDFVYPQATIFINETLFNVNNSLYWQGHTGTDGSWLTGISTYNLTYQNKADYKFSNNNFNGTGTFTTTGTLTSGGAFDVVQSIVKATAGQTANIAEWQNSSGSPLVYITSDGDFAGTKYLLGRYGFGVGVELGIVYAILNNLANTYGSGTYIEGGFQMTSSEVGAGDDMNFQLVGGAAQTANIFEIYDSASSYTLKAYIDKDFNFATVAKGIFYATTVEPAWAGSPSLNPVGLQVGSANDFIYADIALSPLSAIFWGDGAGGAVGSLYSDGNAMIFDGNSAFGFTINQIPAMDFVIGSAPFTPYARVRKSLTIGSIDIPTHALEVTGDSTFTGTGTFAGLNSTGNATIGSLLKLQTMVLPTCSSTYLNSIGANATGTYGCNSTDWVKIF